jgi:drug/metabolite transporter (DMT)-like permease
MDDVTGAPLLHAASYLVPGASFINVQWMMTAVVALAYIVVVSGAGGYLLYFELLDHVGPIETALVGYAVPLFAALSGWVVLGEAVTGRTIVASLVIMLALYSSNTEPSPELKARTRASDSWRP